MNINCLFPRFPEKCLKLASTHLALLILHHSAMDHGWDSSLSAEAMRSGVASGLGLRNCGNGLYMLRLLPQRSCFFPNGTCHHQKPLPAYQKKGKGKQQDPLPYRYGFAFFSHSGRTWRLNYSQVRFLRFFVLSSGLFLFLLAFFCFLRTLLTLLS